MKKCVILLKVTLCVVYIGVSSMNAVDIKWSGIVSWGHPDGILRLKHKLKGPSINLIHTNTNDQITCCNSVSDCKLLFTGTYSGTITAYRTKYNPDKVRRNFDSTTGSSAIPKLVTTYHSKVALSI